MTTNFVTALSVSVFLAATGCAVSGDAGDEFVDSESSATSPGSLDLWQSTDGQWRFNVSAGNGRIMLTSEGYASRTGALTGVLSVLDNGLAADHYATNLTAGGKFNLHLRADNDETIATTETYASRSNATRAIDACVRAIGTYLDHKSSETTGARVDIHEVEDGTMYFNVVAQNGEVVLTSERYNSRVSVLDGTLLAQDAAGAGRATLKTASDGSFYFTLSAANGEVLGTSELYTSRAGAENGIASVQRTLAGLDLL